MVMQSKMHGRIEVGFHYHYYRQKMIIQSTLEDEDSI